MLYSLNLLQSHEFRFESIHIYLCAEPDDRAKAQQHCCYDIIESHLEPSVDLRSIV